MDFYHATAPEHVAGIVSGGFRLPFYEHEDHVLKGPGFLGQGVYISPDWQVALWFNRALLRVRLTQGTRILDVSTPPDMKVITRLRREFNQALLSHNAIFHKIIPRNKHLTGSELVELTKYHFQRSCESDRQRRPHGKSLMQCLSLLRRYQYDGFGDARSAIGIMLLSPERVIVRELLAVVHPGDDEPENFASLRELRDYFRKYGAPRYRQLAERIRSGAPLEEPGAPAAGGPFVRLIR